MATKSKPNELLIERIYDAPVSLVWEAWTDPKKTAMWWGPRGFTITTHAKDLKPGGFWRYTMHGPDGVDYPNHTIYHEVEKHARLVYDHGGYDDRPPLFRVTVTFKELNKKTHMTMIMAFESAEKAAETAKFVKAAGGNGTWDRLAEYLEEKSSGTQKFVMNRSFAVSQDKMYDMWTKPEHFSKWLPPTGFTMEFIKADIKPGGFATYKMTNGADVTMYGRVDYISFDKPNGVKYTQQFTDAQGNISRHPFAPTWPETMLTTVAFTAEDTNRTRVTVTWEVYGKCTDEELAAFVKERGGMTQGWTGSFDKLEEYLGL